MKGNAVFAVHAIRVAKFIKKTSIKNRDSESQDRGEAGCMQQMSEEEASCTQQTSELFTYSTTEVTTLKFLML